MISLGVIGSTIFFLPGILYFVLRTRDATPALQSREQYSSSSLVAIGLIALVSLLSHTFAIGSLWILGLFTEAIGIGTIGWDFSVLESKGKESISFTQVMQLLCYTPYVCVVACFAASLEKRRKIKPDVTNLTLTTLCRAQDGNDDLLLLAYVYYKTPTGSEDFPISGLVGGVSLARLDVGMNLKSIVLIEPVPFYQFISEELQSEILEYTQEGKFRMSGATMTDDEVIRRTIVEIDCDEISHVVYALHDKTQEVMETEETTPA